MDPTPFPALEMVSAWLPGHTRPQPSICLACRSFSGAKLQGVLQAYALPSELLLIDLNNNAISGTIPSNWVLPSKLQNIWIGGGSLTGTLPSSWDLPASLQLLALQSNILFGRFAAGMVDEM